MKNDWSSERIYALRKALGISRERFAQIVGVSANTVYRWEKQGVVPRSLAVLRSLEKLESLAETNRKYKGRISLHYVENNRVDGDRRE